jgi:inner membrane protein involved in colicin E2 resistance
MPILRNAKYERMAQSLAEGKTGKQSYIDAGFAPANARSGASKLVKANPAILQRSRELLQQRVEAQRAVMTEIAVEEAITLPSHLQVLARLRDEARAMGQYGAAIAAEKNRGLAMGYYIDRHEMRHPGDFKRDSAQLKRQLEERLVAIAARQAIEKAAKAA